MVAVPMMVAVEVGCTGGGWWLLFVLVVDDGGWLLKRL